MSSIYKVECRSCGRPFNGMTASPCDCLEQARSLRCPNCAACFCRAPQAFKTSFWANAPRELYARLRTPPVVEEPPNPGPAEVSRPLVLFADDDASARSIVRRVVAHAGYGLVVAKNGEEALQLARDYGPELVITDAFMPGMDGRELARILKSELPSTRIVVVSGVYKDIRYKQEAMRRFDVDDFVAKPISPPELRALLTRHLS